MVVKPLPVVGQKEGVVEWGLNKEVKLVECQEELARAPYHVPGLQRE